MKALVLITSDYHRWEMYVFIGYCPLKPFLHFNYNVGICFGTDTITHATQQKTMPFSVVAYLSSDNVHV